MKAVSVVLYALLLAAPWPLYAGEQIIPAGSLISCTVSEPKLSSKTDFVGDPVLCQLGYSERYGRSTLPYGSYLVGRFEDYKDPGHLVGKGWMELKFDRMIIEPDTVIPVNARVVDVPGYNVDRNGRILGKGHAVRDTIMWMIPILWPIDMINLPRRGPRPALKEETRLTLKVMDDMEVPTSDRPPQQDPNGLYRRPSAYEQQQQQPAPEQPPAFDSAAMEPAPQMPPPPVYYSPPPVYYYYYYPARPPIPMPAWRPQHWEVVMRGGYPYRVYVP